MSPSGARVGRARGRFAEWAANLALAMLSVALTLALLDAGFALGRHLAGHDRMYMFDPVLGWRVLPNLDGALTPYPTYTDVNGFRILPSEPRERRTFDVMMLGDSFCFGSWLGVEQTLAGMLKLAHPELRIANTAVPGFGTDQEMIALGRYAPMLKPGGTVVLLTYINDFDDIRHHWNEVREKPWFTMGPQGLVMHRPDSWLNRFSWSAQVFSVTAYLASRGLRMKLRSYGDDADAAKLYAALVERMAATARARHAHFVVLYTAGRKARTAQGLRWAAVVRATAARADAVFFSLDERHPALGSAMFIPGDIHWNAAGSLAAYRYIAPRLAPFLRPAGGGVTKTAR